MSELIITDIVPTHPQGFGGHVFEYESETDLFRCVGCGKYEVVVRDSATGEIAPCEGVTEPEDGKADGPTGDWPTRPVGAGDHDPTTLPVEAQDAWYAAHALTRELVVDGPLHPHAKLSYVEDMEKALAGLRARLERDVLAADRKAGNR